MGNSQSVVNVVSKLIAKDSKVILTDDYREIDRASHLIFPGQGAAYACKQELEKYQLIPSILKAASTKPFLGICIGLQILLEYSQENNMVECLDVIPGYSMKFSEEKVSVPHIGWNCVTETKPHYLTNTLPETRHFYFAHSYYPMDIPPDYIHGKTFHQLDFPSFIAKDNIALTQFHPEKSGVLGEKFMHNFMQWRP